MCVAPELDKVHGGFAREDLFVCVHEQFLTETARMADIVLPATMFLEHDDIYQASGHTRLQIARKLFEPYAECRPNHDVICELARRLGAPAHPGFEMTEWQLIDDLLARSGWPDAETIWQAGGWDAMPDYATSHHLNGFPTPSGKFQFKPDWSKLGPDHARMPKLPDHFAIIDEADDEHPFRLVAAPARNYLNTSFTETPTSIRKEGRPTVLVHPEDARRLGIAAGDRVRLGNGRGSVRLHAEIREGQQPGVLVVESIWPNAAFEEGIGINALISAEAAPPERRRGVPRHRGLAAHGAGRPHAGARRGGGAGAGMIDLYSDTRTKPTPGMRRAIAEAEVGDEQAMLDPTVNALVRAGRRSAGQGGRGLSAVRHDVQPDRRAGPLPAGRRDHPRSHGASVPRRIRRAGGARRGHDARARGRARHVHAPSRCAPRSIPRTGAMRRARACWRSRTRPTSAAARSGRSRRSARSRRSPRSTASPATWTARA